MRDRTNPRPLDSSFAEAEGSDVPNLAMILDLPLEVSVRLGNTKILIRDLLRLDKNSVLELDQSADDPLDIVVNDRVLARGEVVVIDDRLGIRITDIASRAERVSTLG
jgi:flagellar motor switch protein FliN/FliY